MRGYDPIEPEQRLPEWIKWVFTCLAGVLTMALTVLKCAGEI
jgi:hypothetical protein